MTQSWVGDVKFSQECTSSGGSDPQPFLHASLRSSFGYSCRRGTLGIGALRGFDSGFFCRAGMRLFTTKKSEGIAPNTSQLPTGTEQPRSRLPLSPNSSSRRTTSVQLILDSMSHQRFIVGPSYVTREGLRDRDGLLGRSTIHMHRDSRQGVIGAQSVVTGQGVTTLNTPIVAQNVTLSQTTGGKNVVPSLSALLRNIMDAGRSALQRDCRN